jgi:hypothetical protein
MALRHPWLRDPDMIERAEKLTGAGRLHRGDPIFKSSFFGSIYFSSLHSKTNDAY